jgi:hypothetical protein
LKKDLRLVEYRLEDLANAEVVLLVHHHIKVEWDR